MNDWLFSRRSVLGTAIVGLLGGCGSTTPEAKQAQAGGASEAPFDVWRELQRALRESPDHVEARAEALVAQKDPAAIFRFVVDEIGTHPPAPKRLKKADWAHELRWGVRGTLRGGAGTPRDKAELLRSLLQRAGFADAEVVGLTRSFSEDGERKLFCRPIPRQFAPKLDEATAKSWLERAGIPGPAPLEAHVDADGNAAVALADAIDSAFEQPPEGQAYAFGGERKVPAVRATVAGKKQLFEPIAERPAMTASSEGKKLHEVGSAAVRLRLRARYAEGEKLGRPVTLCEGSWPVSELVGRKVDIQFLPTVKPSQAVLMPVGALTSFIPAMAISGPDVSVQKARQLSVAGDMFQLTGRKVRTQAGRVFSDKVELPQDSHAYEKVASLEAKADASRYPLVRLEVRAKDATGQAVPGLAGGLFSIREGDRSQTAVLVSAPGAKGSKEPTDSYQFEYLAFGKGTTGRVRVGMQCRTLQAETKYTRVNSKTPPPMICGLELEVRLPGQAALTRRIAGWDRMRPKRPIQEAIAETRGALLGSHTLQLEGVSPPRSVLLEGIVRELLALKPMAEAMEQGTEGMLRRLNEGTVRRPQLELALAAVELPQRADGTALTYEHAPKLVSYSKYVVWGSNQLLRRTDMLPLSNLHTLAADAKVARRRTLVNSASLAIAESTLAPKTTYGKLKAGPFKWLDAKHLKGLPADDKRRWRSRSRATVGRWDLFAKDTTASAPYYAVDRFGQLHALLADGSGGSEAAESIRRQLQEYERTLDLLGTVASLMGTSPLIGVAIIHGRLLGRAYAAASMAIIMMDSSGIEATLRKAFAEAACELLKLTGTTLFGKFGGKMADRSMKAFAGLDYLLGLFAAKVGEQNPFSCWS